MYQSIPKLPMPPPSSPWAFEVFEKFWCNYPVCWQFRWSNAHSLALQKASNPPLTSNCSKISQCIKLSIQICHSRKPTFTGFLKGSQRSNKTAHIGAKSCKHHAHTECSKNYKILLLAMLSSILTQKGSNDRLGRPHFGSNSPLYGQNGGQMAGVCTGRGGGWAVLELTAT